MNNIDQIILQLKLKTKFILTIRDKIINFAITAFLQIE
jgi:hypothetical protein